MAAEAIRKLQEELGWVAGPDCKLVVDMAACMKEEGVGFYARQGSAGVDGVWEWDSGTSVCPDSQLKESKGQLRGLGWRDFFCIDLAFNQLTS